MSTPTKSAAEIVKEALKQELKIGQILLTKTSLTEAQLREALAIQKEKGEEPEITVK